jgi:SAM-dependent methyltransferase
LYGVQLSATHVAARFVTTEITMPDLFAGAADHYCRFRPAYPSKALDWIVAQHNLDGTGRLLDCGCGPGNVFTGLSNWFSHTIAMDPDAESAC